MFLNNRYMDPVSGVFISVDPLVAKTGQAYLYAAGNPTTLSDPSGLAACADEDNCGFAGSGTGRTSQLTAKQMSSLEADDGAAWVVQNLDTIWNVCQTDWTTCRDRVHNPSKTWGRDWGDKTESASMYEAYRLAYRAMLSLQRTGKARVLGQFDGGGRFVNARNSNLVLEISGVSWKHGGGALDAGWVDPTANAAIGLSFTICVGVCISGGFLVGSDGFHPYATLGGVGLGGSATVDVVPMAGACSQEGWGLSLGGAGDGVAGGASVSSAGTPGSGGLYNPQWSTVKLSGGAGLLAQVPSSAIGGGPSYTWMAGC